MPARIPTWRPRAFYGWYVVYAVGIVLMTTSGLAFYNLSVLLDAFIAERGFPVALTSGATASFFIASGAGGVIAGRLMDRVDARLIMIAGAAPWLGALFFLGVVPVTAWIVRSSPQEMGLVPDGSERAARGAQAFPLRNVSYAQARRSRFFIGLTATYLFGLGAQVGAITH